MNGKLSSGFNTGTLSSELCPLGSSVPHLLSSTSLTMCCGTSWTNLSSLTWTTFSFSQKMLINTHHVSRKCLRGCATMAFLQSWRSLPSTKPPPSSLALFYPQGLKNGPAESSGHPRVESILEGQGTSKILGVFQLLPAIHHQLCQMMASLTTLLHKNI